MKRQNKRVELTGDTIEKFYVACFCGCPSCNCQCSLQDMDALHDTSTANMEVKNNAIDARNFDYEN